MRQWSRRKKKMKILAAPAREFKNLLRDATREDLEFLGQWDSHVSRVKIYDPVQNALLSLNDLHSDDKPCWPLVWLAIRFNRKHLVMKRKNIDWTGILHELTQFEETIKWRWFLRHSESTPSLKIPFSKTPKISTILPPGLKCWIGQFRRRMMATLKSANQKAPKNVTCGRLMRFCLKRVQNYSWIAVLNDKEPGVTFMKKHQLCDVGEKILSGSAYLEMSPLNLNINEIGTTYEAMCKNIANAMSIPALKTNLLKSWFVDDATVISTLSINCKSHKRFGETAWRNIHASNQWVLNGIIIWVFNMLS